MGRLRRRCKPRGGSSGSDCAAPLLPSNACNRPRSLTSAPRKSIGAWRPATPIWRGCAAGAYREEARLRPVLINAVVDSQPTFPPTQVEIAPALVIDSHLAGPLATQGAAIIANVETSQPLTLGRDVVLHQLPVPQGYVTRLFGLRDDPKLASFAAGATLLNRAWADWLAGDDDLVAALWPDLDAAERTLWNARLFPVSADREESLALTLPLQDPAHAPAGWREQWLAAPRLSLGESFRQADGERILAETAAIEDRVAAQHCCHAILAEQPASEAKALLTKIPGATGRRVQIVSQWLADADTILQLRGYAALAAATGDAAWEDRAFETLAEIG